MSDLPARLRAHANTLRKDGVGFAKSNEFLDMAADTIEQLLAALKQAVDYADVVSLKDGMPEGKQATRLTASWVGKDIRYSAEWDVKAARALAYQQSERKS